MSVSVKIEAPETTSAPGDGTLPTRCTVTFVDSKRPEGYVHPNRATITTRPREWTDEEYIAAMEGWSGTQTQLIDLIRRAGPACKIRKEHYGHTTYVYFEYIVLDIVNDPRTDGILADERHASPDSEDPASKCVLAFTHPDSEVSCSLHADDGYGREGKPIIMCRAHSVDQSPGLDSDDDMNEHQRLVDTFGVGFQAKRLEEPITVEFPLPQ